MGKSIDHLVVAEAWLIRCELRQRHTAVEGNIAALRLYQRIQAYYSRKKQSIKPVANELFIF